MATNSNSKVAAAASSSSLSSSPVPTTNYGEENEKGLESEKEEEEEDVYHDYANEGLDSSSSSTTSPDMLTTTTTTTKNGTNVEQNFPMKLHYMLNDMESDGLDHIVSWQPHGRAFIVHKPEEFTQKILPL